MNKRRRYQAKARRAARAREQRNAIHLSPRDQQVFVAALLNPPEPNEALRRAFEKHGSEVQ